MPAEFAADQFFGNRPRNPHGGGFPMPQPGLFGLLNVLHRLLQRRNDRGQLIFDHPLDRLQGGLTAVLFRLAANRFRFLLSFDDDLQCLRPNLGKIPLRPLQPYPRN